MVNKIPPEKLLPLFENMPDFPKSKKSSQLKEYISDMAHLFYLAFGRIYEDDELELIYYLIEDFLDGKKFTRSIDYYKSITGDFPKALRKHIKFKSLKRRKEDFDKTFNSLKKKEIVLSPKNKPQQKNERDKYFWLDLQKLSHQFNLNYRLLYFTLHYLVLEKSEYEKSLEIAEKIAPKLNELFGDK